MINWSAVVGLTAKRSCWLGTALCAALAGGCATRSTVRFVSYKDPPFPERYDLVFDDCAFQKNASGDYYVAAIARDGRLMPALSGKRNATAQAAATGRQSLDAHVYWKPTPGKTASNRTSLDAVVRFIVETPQGTAVYRGTGFAYLRKDAWTGRTVVQLETGRLRVDTLTGSPPEILGDASVAGRLFARPDGNRAVDILREADLVAAGKP